MWVYFHSLRTGHTQCADCWLCPLKVYASASQLWSKDNMKHLEWVVTGETTRTIERTFFSLLLWHFHNSGLRLSSQIGTNLKLMNDIFLLKCVVSMKISWVWVNLWGDSFMRTFTNWVKNHINGNAGLLIYIQIAYWFQVFTQMQWKFCESRFIRTCPEHIRTARRIRLPEKFNEGKSNGAPIKSALREICLLWSFIDATNCKSFIHSSSTS